MDFSELATILIFTAQQLGVILGVGAQTVLLVAHLIALHGGEHGVESAARKARGAGIFLMIISGAAAVGLHAASSAMGILLEPAFLFKWGLIIAILLLHLFETKLPHLIGIAEGFSGANWYALFLVHTLAPVTDWWSLLVLYAGWIALFGILWTGFSLLMHGAKPSSKIPAPEVKPRGTPKPILQTTAKPPSPFVASVEEGHNLPAVQHVLIPKSEVQPQKVKEDAVMETTILPAIRIMPRTPEEISKHYRGSAVNLNP